MSYESEGGYDLGFGSRAVYSCDPGFISDVENVLSCEEDGEWHGDLYPCREVQYYQTYTTRTRLIDSEDNTFVGSVWKASHPVVWFS